MDEVIIGIGINDNKKTWFPMDKRLEMIRGLFADEPRIRVEAYDCLTVDFAKEQNISRSMFFRKVKSCTGITPIELPCIILSTRKPLPISIGSWRE